MVTATTTGLYGWYYMGGYTPLPLYYATANWVWCPSGLPIPSGVWAYGYPNAYAPPAHIASYAPHAFGMDDMNVQPTEWGYGFICEVSVCGFWDFGSSGPRVLGSSGPRVLGSSGPRVFRSSGPRVLGS